MTRGDVRQLDELPPEDTAAIEGVGLKDLVGLKRKYGKWVLWMMAAQLVMANGVFITYAWVGYDWKIPASVMQIWLGATFVQVVGVVIVITRSLFPREDLRSLGRTDE